MTTIAAAVLCIAFWPITLAVLAVYYWPVTLAILVLWFAAYMVVSLVKEVIALFTNP